MTFCLGRRAAVLFRRSNDLKSASAAEAAAAKRGQQPAGPMRRAQADPLRRPGPGVVADREAHTYFSLRREATTWRRSRELPMESSALPADCGVRPLVSSARGWGGGFSLDPSSPPAKVVVAWCRSRKPSADQVSSSEAAHLSCRRRQPGGLTGQLGCRDGQGG
jgi:hypothetical protein